MTLSTVAVGALIRKQIQNTTLEPAMVIPIPVEKIDENHIYADENEIKFELNSIYLGYEVHGIVKCKTLKKDEDNLYKDGRVYPVKKDKRIIRPSGKTSELNWEQFHNNYRFEPIAITKKKLTSAQIEAKLFTYNENERKLRDEAGKKANIKYYTGVIAESIDHCKKKLNMSVILDVDVIKHLRESLFWLELDHQWDITHRFDNRTMGSTIWKYKEAWIISSHSAYLKIMDGDK